MLSIILEVPHEKALLGWVNCRKLISARRFVQSLQSYFASFL